MLQLEDPDLDYEHFITDEMKSVCKSKLLKSSYAGPWRAVYNGDLSELKRFHEEEGVELHGLFVAIAASLPHMDMLRYLHESGCEFWELATTWAAEAGNLEALKLLRSYGCPWSERTVAGAAIYGHRSVVKWAISNGCKMDASACCGAATRGDERLLEFLHSQGCPLYGEYITGETKYIYSASHGAATSGCLRCLKFAYKFGCPIDELSLILSINSGRSMQCYHYLMNRDCPFSTGTIETAILREWYDEADYMLQWLPYSLLLHMDPSISNRDEKATGIINEYLSRSPKTWPGIKRYLLAQEFHTEEDFESAWIDYKNDMDMMESSDTSEEEPDYP